MHPIPTALLVACLLASPPAHADAGLVSVKSSHDVAGTVERLEAALKAKGIPVIAKDPKYLASRHGVPECGDVVRKMAAALEGLATAATKP